jgi:NADPH:quinone reductase-like Zn-dependent oxidoreductase
MTTLPDTMVAIDPDRVGGPEVLQPVERPVPQPGPGEVLIKVEAAGVNRPDVLQRLGAYPPPPGAPSIPGLEVAGRVVGVGAGLFPSAWLAKRVCALLPAAAMRNIARFPPASASTSPARSA